ncbi:MAG: sugar phosphate isomerase/epimerase [Oscillospiraceae bacterium]|nr:sugar phosphate isomerase/epimerase [Oscillospiraceae bacterium]
MQLGAQLYTVREYTQTLDDFALSLDRVAAIGYKTVQVSGTCAYEADWLSEQLKKRGLHCVLTHYSPDAMLEDAAAVAEKHKYFDCRHIGIGSMPGGMEKYGDFVANFNPVAKEFAKHDCLLMYHNHDAEFARSHGGQLYLEKLAEDFAPSELGFTLDTYWVQAGGGDPAWWIHELAGRVPCVHLKDMSFDGGQRMAAIYEGNMNFDAILKACEDAKTEYLLIEQDDCYGEDPFACLARSYENLKAKGLS